MKSKLLPITFMILLLLTGFVRANEDAVITPTRGGATVPVKNDVLTSKDAITIPRMLSYQGRLTDNSGSPVPNGNYQLTFRLYQQENGGSPFWTETQTVSVQNGLFSVLLGSVTPITSLPDGGTVWLSLQVGAEPELSPRLRIVSAAYSFLSEKAQTLDQNGASSGQVLKWNGSAWVPANDETGGSGTVTSVSQSTGIICTPNPITSTGTVAFDQTYGDNRYVNEGQANSITSAMIVDNTIATGDIADNAITSAKIQNGTIVGADLNQMGANNGQVLKWNGTTWAPADDQTGGTGDNAWVRGTPPDSVLYTIRQLGIARGGANNMLYGSYRYTHTNFGVACTTGTSANNLYYCTVGGGYQNNAYGAASTIAGGTFNRAGYFGAVLGGLSNQALGNYATVGGGGRNYSSGSNATVAGGDSNTAAANYATVAGGQKNSVSATGGAIGGGANNSIAAGGQNNVIAGGGANAIGGTIANATISGGYSNQVTGGDGAIGGGSLNRVTAVRGVVGGGYSNVCSGSYATVAGGESNVASGDNAFVGGGYNDSAANSYATIGGGSTNKATARWSTVAGGVGNVASNEDAVVAGGWANTASGYDAAVLGGYMNTAAGFRSVVTGGRMNYARDTCSFVGGGFADSAKGKFATVAGGDSNTASGNWATVCGGWKNTASNDRAAIGGGYGNTASSYSATVAGGYLNIASATCATVAGGYCNSASGTYSTVAGGWGDTAAASYSFAVGNFSIVPSGYTNSAAFNGQTATASNQLRCGTISKAGGTFTIDHPVDPYNKILNHYFIEGPEMRNIYEGSVVIGADGRAEVKLPDYFSALNRNPHIQLTGVGTSDVYVAEDVSGNRFVIGGKPGTKVYWLVTGERQDVSAEAIRRTMPVEQPKTGALAGRMLDDEFLSGCMEQLEREGKAAGINFRTAEGRRRYEQMKSSKLLSPEEPEKR